jgi:hypothetical protein
MRCRDVRYGSPYVLTYRIRVSGTYLCGLHLYLVLCFCSSVAEHTNQYLHVSLNLAVGGCARASAE